MMKTLDDCEENKLANPTILPKDIIFEILSFLPVKSVLRFKSVCKQWNAIAQDHQFTCLHWRRSPGAIYDTKSAGGEDEFVAITVQASLILYRTIGSSALRYGIRNAATRQVLEVPNPVNPCLDMEFVLLPSNNVAKLVSVHNDENQGFGYEVLDLWNGNSYSWRPLKVPKFPNNGQSGTRKRIRICYVEGVAFCIWEVETSQNCDIELDILDMQNESFVGNTSLPRGFLSSCSFISWKDKLSFAEIVEDELHVLVLDDYKKQKWAENKLIMKLTFLKKEVKERIDVCFADKSRLIFCWPGKKSVCEYDTNTGAVKTLLSNYEHGVSGLIRPCLFTFEGMRAF